jgi:hypothetical protein
MREVRFRWGASAQLASIRDFLHSRPSWWDHLLMDQGDPEKRIADPEDQPAESRTA